jgi:gluconokinase
MMFLTVMGVAGSGKSSLGRAVAQAMQLPLIEGDDFHAPASRDKMRRGVPLDDADREGWLDRLCAELHRHPQGAVLSCSALKRSYRERLRGGVPGLRFAFLQIGQSQARERVAARAAEHLFPPSLVASQFATLEPPLGEPGVLCLDAMRPLAELSDEALRWLRREECAP